MICFGLLTTFSLVSRLSSLVSRLSSLVSRLLSLLFCIASIAFFCYLVCSARLGSLAGSLSPYTCFFFFLSLVPFLFLFFLSFSRKHSLSLSLYATLVHPYASAAAGLEGPLELSPTGGSVSGGAKAGPALPPKEEPESGLGSQETKP